jgi:membrane protein
MIKGASSLLKRKSAFAASVLHSIWGRCYQDNSLDTAAQVSFYFALSMFPFLLVLAALVGWIPTTTRWDAFATWLSNYLPTRTQQTMLTLMLDLSRNYGKFLSFGLVLAVWSASTGFLCLMEALARAYGLRDRRGYVKRRLIAMSATVLAAIFLVLCFWIWNAGHLLVISISTDFTRGVFFKREWTIVRAVGTLTMLWLAVNLIHHYLPGRHRRWHWLTFGSSLSVISLFLTSALLNVYVNHSGRMSRVYGTLTGFIVLMLWIYIANLSLLVGAETDTAVAELKTHGAGA